VEVISHARLEMPQLEQGRSMVLLKVVNRL